MKTKKVSSKLILLLSIFLVFNSFNKDDVSSYDCKDADGNVYKTVKIGNQVWMVENLKVTKFNDGTSIPNVTDGNEWVKLKTPGYCWYENDATNKSTYGALYNWYAVNKGKLAPKGWHMPTQAEWETLITFLGGKEVASGKLKVSSTSNWKRPDTGATNGTGFTALPGGNRINYNLMDGTILANFMDKGECGSWWSSTESSSLEGSYEYLELKYGDRLLGNGSQPKNSGFSVRCIRDN